MNKFIEDVIYVPVIVSENVEISISYGTSKSEVGGSVFFESFEEAQKMIELMKKQKNLEDITFVILRFKRVKIE